MKKIPEPQLRVCDDISINSLSTVSDNNPNASSNLYSLQTPFINALYTAVLGSILITRDSSLPSPYHACTCTTLTLHSYSSLHQESTLYSSFLLLPLKLSDSVGFSTWFSFFWSVFFYLFNSYYFHWHKKILLWHHSHVLMNSVLILNGSKAMMLLLLAVMYLHLLGVWK